jgi:hypothetical protein
VLVVGGKVAGGKRVRGYFQDVLEAAVKAAGEAAGKAVGDGVRGQS